MQQLVPTPSPRAVGPISNTYLGSSGVPTQPWKLAPHTYSTGIQNVGMGPDPLLLHHDDLQYDTGFLPT